METWVRMAGMASQAIKEDKLLRKKDSALKVDGNEK